MPPSAMVHPLRGAGLHGLHDAVVAGAAAQVAVEPLADLVLGRPGLVLEEVDRREDHARRAEAALQTVVLAKSLLHRVQLAVAREALDGGHLRAVRLDGEHRAALHGATADQHGARAALAGVAADVRAREREALAQELDEEHLGLDVGAHVSSIDAQLDGFHAFLRATRRRMKRVRVDQRVRKRSPNALTGSFFARGWPWRARGTAGTVGRSEEEGAGADTAGADADAGADAGAGADADAGAGSDAGAGAASGPPSPSSSTRILVAKSLKSCAETAWIIPRPNLTILPVSCTSAFTDSSEPPAASGSTWPCIVIDTTSAPAFSVPSPRMRQGEGRRRRRDDDDARPRRA